MSDALREAAKNELPDFCTGHASADGVNICPICNLMIPTPSVVAGAMSIVRHHTEIEQEYKDEIAEQEQTIERLAGELNQECGDYKELLDDSAVMAKDNIQLRGEVERLRHLFQVIDESYNGGPATRAEHMLVVFNLVQKALSNDAGGENE